MRLWWKGNVGRIRQKRVSRNSLNCGIASKIRIAATPTNVCDRTYGIFLHVYNSNFKQPIDV